MAKKHIYLTEKQIEGIKTKLLKESTRDNLLLPYLNLLQQKGSNATLGELKVFLMRKFVTEANIHALSLNSNYYLAGVARYYFNGDLTTNKQLNVFYPRVTDKFIPEVCNRLDEVIVYLRNVYIDNRGMSFEQPEDFGTLSITQLFRKYGGKIDKLKQKYAALDNPQDSKPVKINNNVGKNYTFNIMYSYEDCQQYNQATTPGAWCITYGQQHYNAYTKRNSAHFIIFAKNGYENIPRKTGNGFPLDEYGLSLLAVRQSNTDGSFVGCTTRWNHGGYGGAPNVPNADNALTYEQLKQVTGLNDEQFKGIFETWKENAQDKKTNNRLLQQRDKIDVIRKFKYIEILLRNGATLKQLLDDGRIYEFGQLYPEATDFQSPPKVNKTILKIAVKETDKVYWTILDRGIAMVDEIICDDIFDGERKNGWFQFDTKRGNEYAICQKNDGKDLYFYLYRAHKILNVDGNKSWTGVQDLSETLTRVDACGSSINKPFIVWDFEKNAPIVMPNGRCMSEATSFDKLAVPAYNKKDNANIIYFVGDSSAKQYYFYNKKTKTFIDDLTGYGAYRYIETANLLVLFDMMYSNSTERFSAPKSILDLSNGQIITPLGIHGFKDVQELNTYGYANKDPEADKAVGALRGKYLILSIANKDSFLYNIETGEPFCYPDGSMLRFTYCEIKREYAIIAFRIDNTWGKTILYNIPEQAFYKNEDGSLLFSWYGKNIVLDKYHMERELPKSTSGPYWYETSKDIELKDVNIYLREGKKPEDIFDEMIPQDNDAYANYYIVSLNGAKNLYMGSINRVLLDEWCEEIGNFHCDRAAVKRISNEEYNYGNVYNYLKPNGVFLFEKNLGFAGEFDEVLKRAIVKEHSYGLSNIIDVDGHFMHHFGFSDIRNPDHNYLCYDVLPFKKRKYRYLSINGNVFDSYQQAKQDSLNGVPEYGKIPERLLESALNKKTIYLTEEQVKYINEALLQEISIHDKYKLETEKGRNKLSEADYFHICMLDPTVKVVNNNAQAGKYCNWLLQHVTREQIQSDDFCHRMKVALEQYNDGAKRGILRRNGISSDIGSFKTTDELLSAMRELMGAGAQVSSSVSNHMEALKGQYEIVGESPNWFVVKPLTYEAERYFGSHTDWCTVANKEYFDGYTKWDALYITTPKNGDNKLKMQFYFRNHSYATYDDEVYKNPKECIYNAVKENDEAFDEVCDMWDKIHPGFNQTFRFVKISEVQSLLDNGTSPDTIFDYTSVYCPGYIGVGLHGRYNVIKKEHNKYVLLSPNKWFYNLRGKFIIENAEYPYFIIETARNKYNVLSYEGKVLYKKSYDRLGKLHDGWAVVQDGKSYNYINLQGNLLLSINPEVTYDFIDGYGKIYLTGKGFNEVDTQGNLIFDRCFSQINNGPYMSAKNQFIVMLNDRIFNIANADGKLLTPSLNYLSAEWDKELDAYKVNVPTSNKIGKTMLFVKPDGTLYQWHLNSQGTLYDLHKLSSEEIRDLGLVMNWTGYQKATVAESKTVYLTENRESKNMSKARNLLYQQGYSQDDAQKTIEAIRNDIPNARLADCKFLPGVTRMYLNRELSHGNTIMKLNKTLKYVASDAHVNEYDNNLNGLSVNDLVQRFAGVQQQDADVSRAESYGKQFTRNNAYTIVRIPDAKTAAKYGRYTSWCVTHDEDMYNSYTNDGTGLFYFCLRNGFKNEQPNVGENCPLDSYGLSMIAVSITMDGELNTCTCRWNHDNGGNDNIMDKNQLEGLLGVNFYEVFKPYTREELHARDVILFDEVPELLAQGKKPTEIFDDVYGFFKGYAIVELKDKWNFINTNGKLLSPNQWFDYVRTFFEGYARVQLNDKFNFINTNGEFLWNKPVNEWFDDADDFHDGYAEVQLNGEYYILRSDGVLCDFNTKEPLANQQMISETKKVKRIYLTENQVDEIQQRLEQARQQTNTNPTKKQKDAGNYKMGRVRIFGFDIAIENPKGSYRRGEDKNGDKWEVLMKNDYGYFSHTLGKDGDAVDVFIGDDFNSKSVFAIDQKIDGKFDETKVMLGFKTEQEAKNAYMANYNKGWNGFWKITEVSLDVFKKWLYDGYRQRKPFFEYDEIKKKKLNESYKQEWENNAIKQYQTNGVIKLYHNTTFKNLAEILKSGIMRIDMEHKEGHGDMLWFTVKPDDYGSEIKTSIEVPVSKFENGSFKFMNNIHAITETNLNIYEYSFKIESMILSFDGYSAGFHGDRLKGLATNQPTNKTDAYLFKEFANKYGHNKDIAYILNWYKENNI